MEIQGNEILLVDANIIIRHVQQLVNFSVGKEVFLTPGVLHEIKDQKTLEKFHMYEDRF